MDSLINNFEIAYIVEIQNSTNLEKKILDQNERKINKLEQKNSRITFEKSI